MVFSAYKEVTTQKPGFSWKAVTDLTDLLGLACDDRSTAAANHAVGCRHTVTLGELSKIFGKEVPCVGCSGVVSVSSRPSLQPGKVAAKHV